jgi:hypothetical protein
MRMLMLLGLVAMLAACGGAPAAAVPTAPPALDAETQAVVSALQERLATTTGVEASTLTLVSAQPMTWNDSALGCGTPNGAALQVIVEGYMLVFSDGSRTYNVHAGGPDGPAVLCDNGVPQALER